jgi:peroxidase
MALSLAVILFEPVLQAATYRSIDGTDNNALYFEWGSTGEALLRIGPVRYADGINQPAGPRRPSARLVSNVIAETGDARIISDRQLSAMIAAWGQFILSDITLVRNNQFPPEPFDIPVPSGDPFFDAGGTGTQVIHFNRSEVVPGTGTDFPVDVPRQQANAVTAFLDASTVYGSDRLTANKLRTFLGGAASRCKPFRGWAHFFRPTTRRSSPGTLTVHWTCTTTRTSSPTARCSRQATYGRTRASS